MNHRDFGDLNLLDSALSQFIFSLEEGLEEKDEYEFELLQKLKDARHALKEQIGNREKICGLVGYMNK